MSSTFKGMTIKKEEIIEDDEIVQYFGRLTYTFEMAGSYITASREMYNHNDIEEKAYFGRFRPKPTTFFHLLLGIRKMIYKLKETLSPNKALFYLYNGLEPDGFDILPEIPYQNKLFKTAVKYLVTEEKITEIAVLTVRSEEGYEKVNIEKILKNTPS